MNDDRAQSGSAWPQFAVRYYRERNRPIGIVGAARGGTSLAPNAGGNGNWDSGQLGDDLIGWTNRAITRFESAGVTVNYHGVLWHQGERDAQALDDGMIERDDHRRALENMVANYRGALGNETRFWIFELGRPASETTTGFQAIRAVQNEFAATQEFTHVVSRVQEDFPERGFMQDELHYNQEGYNRMGDVGGAAVAEVLE
jgi:hypothetical protein